MFHSMVIGRIAAWFADVPVRMIGDAKLLFQVFSNLLSNAIKYSPGGGAIEVAAENTADEVVVAISDHGIGIPPSDLDRLFERYHRGSNVSGIVGTGVGLYLVKMVVDLQGGSIAVKSREGEGARFAMNDAASPTVVRDTADGSALYVLMPMRV